MQTSEAKCSRLGNHSTSVATARRVSGFIDNSTAVFLGKIVVASIILFVLVKSLHPRTLLVVLKTADRTYLAIAVVLLAPNLLVQTLKWRYLLKLVASDISFLTAVRSLLGGYPLGFITPGRLGEMGRSLFVKNINRLEVLKLFVLDKGTNLTVTILFGCLGILFLSQSFLNAGNSLKFIAAIAIIACVLSLFLAPVTCKIVARLTKLSKYDWRTNLVVFIFSLGFYLIFLSQFVVLAFAFQKAELFSASQAAASVFLAKSVLPFSFNDLGIREGAAVFFFKQIGVNSAAAFNAAFALFLINIGVPTLFGLPVLLKLKKKQTIPSLRAMESLKVNDVHKLQHY